MLVCSSFAKDAFTWYDARALPEATPATVVSSTTADSDDPDPGSPVRQSPASANDGARPAATTVVPSTEPTRTPSASPRCTRSSIARAPVGFGAPVHARPAASAVARARSQ